MLTTDTQKHLIDLIQDPGSCYKVDIITPQKALKESEDIKDDSIMKIEVCTSVPCVRTATDLLKLIDTKVDPCEDFYRFACGSFLQHTDLDNRGFISVQNFIEDEIHSEIRNILEQPIRQESPKSLDTAKKFYRACMNESAIDAAGLKKIKEILERIGGWPTLLENNWQEDDFDWLAVVHKLREMGVNFGVFYLVSVYRDEIDESRYVLGAEKPLCKNLSTASLASKMYLMKRVILLRASNYI
ncbi:unnamed protein product [Phaedon cochleariae]|uniref:Peptidase M13 N-terminal domain-containing protein n=1 Tax=Phaedon cochleariae TaxID=80249 RepID=A0A9N9SC26_PHACE|nr:unnamed protein product [Phaedon cochleariae]